MIDKLRQLDETFLDLVIGIFLYGVVSGILGMIITKGNLWFLLGILIGILSAVGMIIHMMVSIQKAVEMDSHDASRYMVKCTMIRYFVMLLIMIPGIKMDFICFIGIITGILSSKFSALLHRVIHQHLTRRILKE